MSRIRKLSINRICREWRAITQNEKDVHVAICGDEGEGKTQLMIQFINKFPWTNLKKNMVYSSIHKEFYDKYEHLKQFSIIGFDEGLDFLDRQLWAKLETKNLLKFVRGTVRKEKSGVFLYNAQLFRDLHPYWRNHRIRYWIELLKRDWFDGANIAVVLRKGRVPFITGHRDTWLMDDSEKEWLSRLARYGNMPRKEYINSLRRHPFYVGEFVFKKLPESTKQEYMNNRLEALSQYKPEEPKEKITKRDIALGRLLAHCKHELNMPYTKLGRIAGFSDKSIKSIIQELEHRSSE